MTEAVAHSIQDTLHGLDAALLDHFQVGMFVIDRDQRIMHANDTATQLLGLGADQAWPERRLDQIDAVIGSGMCDRFEETLNGGKVFCRSALQCTNSAGQYWELDLCCRAVGPESDRQVLGLVRQSRADTNEAAYNELREELHILAEVASALSSTQELPQVLKVILTGATASQGLGFNRAFLFLYVESNNRLEGHLAVGPSSAEEAGNIWRNLDAVRLSLAELLTSNTDRTDSSVDRITDLIADLRIDLTVPSVISKTCRDGQWLIIQHADDMDSVTTALTDRLGTRDLALVPMVSKGSLRGLLVADNLYTGRAISDEDVRLLHVLANQAAVAMERATLYDAQIERTREVEHINHLLAQSQDQIIKFEKMSVIGELTSVVAHELRNPLTIVGGFANLLLKSEISDHQRQYLNIIAGEVRRAESVLEHVLDFSRASRGQNEVIDWSQLVERSYQLLQARCRGHYTEIDLHLAAEPIEVFGNTDQLAHAVYQLLKLVAEELIPPGTALVRTERRDGEAWLLIELRVPQAQRERSLKQLRQIFSENGTTQRLTVMVAGETIKYHGGSYSLVASRGDAPSLRVKLPCHRRENDH